MNLADRPRLLADDRRRRRSRCYTGDRRGHPAPSCAARAEALAALLRDAGVAARASGRRHAAERRRRRRRAVRRVARAVSTCPLNPRLTGRRARPRPRRGRPGRRRHHRRPRRPVRRRPGRDRDEAHGTRHGTGSTPTRRHRPPTSPSSSSPRAPPAGPSRCCCCTTACSPCSTACIATLRGRRAKGRRATARPTRRSARRCPTSSRCRCRCGPASTTCSSPCASAPRWSSWTASTPATSPPLVERFRLRSTVLPPAAMTMLGRRRRRSRRWPRCATSAASPRRCRRCRPAGSRTVRHRHAQLLRPDRDRRRDRRLDRRRLQGVRRRQARRGRPPHEGVRVRDRTSRAGELQVLHPGAAAGYADGGDLPTGSTADGWFRTGDVGRVDAEGFVWIEGRVSRHDQPRRPQGLPRRGRGGPAPVARRRRRAPSPASPDDRLGEVPWAFVVPAPGAPLDADGARRARAASTWRRTRCRCGFEPRRRPAPQRGGQGPGPRAGRGRRDLRLRLDRVRALFAGPHPHQAGDRRRPDLAVTDLAGPRRARRSRRPPGATASSATISILTLGRKSTWYSAPR